MGRLLKSWPWRRGFDVEKWKSCSEDTTPCRDASNLDSIQALEKRSSLSGLGPVAVD